MPNELNTAADWWHYENLPSGAPYSWAPAARGEHEFDNIDFHLDLGSGKLPKGRLGIDRYYAPNVGLLIDLEDLITSHASHPEHGRFPDERALPVLERTERLFDETDLEGIALPFPDDSIESIISHHFMEHLDTGFLPLMDECHRVLKPGGILRVIVPLFPSRTAVEDPDHKRYFMEGTFETFCGDPEGNHWHESFSVPYTKCRFEKVHQDISPRPENPADYWGEADAREIRVALRKRAL
jgi:SAM-dependent methyltransferase